MGLNYYKYHRYRHLVDDDLIRDAIELLERRRKEFAEYIEENDPLEVCPECGSNNTGYKWNKRLCNDCGYEEDYDVPMPYEGGKSGSRSMFSIIKELFGSRMNQEKTKSKPSQKDIDEIPISLENFDTGEYTQAQVDFLNERYRRYADSFGDLEPNDEFLISALVKQELKVFMLSRQEAINRNSVSSNDKQKEIKLLIELAKEMKSTKATRTNDEEKSAMNELYDKFKDDEDIEDLLERFEEERKERKKILEESKKAREDAGNPY